MRNEDDLVYKRTMKKSRWIHLYVSSRVRLVALVWMSIKKKENSRKILTFLLRATGCMIVAFMVVHGQVWGSAFSICSAI